MDRTMGPSGRNSTAKMPPMAGLFRFFTKSKRPAVNAARPGEAPGSSTCPVCQSTALHLDTVDFNRSCEANGQQRLPLSGLPVHYYLCVNCKFCFAPEIQAWTREQFAERIYNAEYASVDPDYLSVRPVGNADMIDGVFGISKDRVRHLDYGGGSGLLSSTLREKGWDSRSYDPFVNVDQRVEDLGRFDLVTAFEVFEHVPDVARLMDDLDAVLEPDGMLVFTTLLCDNEVALGRPLRWWYAGPRNGHISLFSRESLKLSLDRKALGFRSVSPGTHAAFRSWPDWASHLAVPAA